MRNLLLFLLGSACSLAQAQLNVGLKAHWTFSGGSTSDMSGNAHNGSIVGTATPTMDRAGNMGCAYLFPGDASHIAIPYATDFDIAPAGAFTVSLWYQGGSQNAGDLEWLFRKQNTPQLYHSWNYGLALYDLNRALYFGGDDENLWSPAEPPIPDTQWHNLVAVYSNGSHQLFLDGNLMASDMGQTLFVSQSMEGLSIGESFQGAMDDIRFYDRALNATEVGSLFEEQGACSTTGIDEEQATAISIAPNPTSSTVTVRLGDHASSALRSIELFDATGRSVRRTTATAMAVTLDLGDLPKGLYLLRCGTGDKALVRRITKD